MAEYIEREAALEAVKKEREYVGKFSFEEERAWGVGVRQGISFALSDIAAVPAADVRPVVFCRDCDCWNEWDSAGRESIGNYVCSCAHWSVEDGAILYTSPTDFCSYGERKEES